MDAAAHLVSQGRFGEAVAALDMVIAAQPRASQARRLLALSLQRLGDSVGAERQLRAGLKLDRANEGLALALADLLIAADRHREAERVLRVVSDIDRQSSGVAVALSQVLVSLGRPAQALQLTAPLVAGAAPAHAVLAQHADTLKTLGQLDEALSVYEQAATTYPASSVAHHNLASALGDLARFTNAETSAVRAFQAGGKAPETWLVYARALLGQNRLDEAERAFGEAVRRRPDYVEAHRDLAQLIWMRSEDAGRAVTALDAALRLHPQSVALFETRATVLKYAGDVEGAYQTLGYAIARYPEVASLRIAAAHLASLAGNAQAGLAHAEAAVALGPANPGAQTTLAELSLAVGDAERAATLTQSLLKVDPFDQNALAYQATAWRLLGDERYADHCDYGTLVRSWRLDTPNGWDTLDEYLADLATALELIHPFKTHPLEQSLRHGSQAPHLAASQDPAIKAFFQAVDGPIRRHIANLGRGDGPVRSRNLGGYEFDGAWSVRLRPGGFHTDHIHPQGWLSSACYIALPEAVTGSSGREGWIKFGEPGVATQPALGAEHFVEPEPGLLVLFPSYMWHGTVRFTGEQPRLTIAFDLRPAPAPG